MKDGKLVMETVFEVDHYYQIPVDKKSWQVRRKTKRFVYKIRELTRGSVFGHEELFMQVDRRCRVVALSHCTVVYINKKEFLSAEIDAQREKLEQTYQPISIEQLTERVAKDARNKKYRSNAIFDATRLNPAELGGARSMNSDQQQMSSKIGSWLEQAKLNKTNNQQLLHQLRKLRCISEVEAEPITVGLSEESREKVTEMMQVRARFIMPSAEQERLEAQAAKQGRKVKSRESDLPNPRASEVMSAVRQ